MQGTPPQQQKTKRAHTGTLPNGDYQRAHSLAMESTARRPRPLAEAYFIMALIAHRHGNVAKAEEIVQRALGFAGGTRITCCSRPSVCWS